MWDLGLVIFLHTNMSKFTANELISLLKGPLGQVRREETKFKKGAKEKNERLVLTLRIS